MTALIFIDLLQEGFAFCLWFILLLLALRCSLGAEKGTWFLPSRDVRKLQRAYILVLIAAFLVWRAPELNFPQQYDPDESEFIAVAHRMPVDVVGWRFCDLGTCGPLPIYLLGWPLPLGFRPDYFTGRLTEIACLFATLFFLLKSINSMIGRRHALLVLFSATTFYLMAHQTAFIHYCAEDLPVALLAASAWLIIRLIRKLDWETVLVLGIIAGALPFTKSQAIPIAVYLFAITLILLCSVPGKRFISPLGRRRCFWPLFTGILIVPCLVLLPVIFFGQWDRFIQRYIIHALTYGPKSFTPTPASPLENALLFYNYIKPFFAGLVAFCAFALMLKIVARIPGRDFFWFKGFAILFGYLAVTIAVILKPGTFYPHYLLFLIVPATLISAWSLRGLLRGPRPLFFVQHSLALPLLFFTCCIFPLTLDYSAHFYDRPHLSDHPQADKVLSAIKAAAKPGNTMAIWGYAPEYFVESGLPPATRFTVTTSVPGKYYDAYRADFLSDLKKYQPSIFIDATGGALLPIDVYGWAHPLEKSRYTIYPPLADYISAHYHFQAEIASPSGLLPVLFFVRNDPAAPQ